uniref:Uncharacterized protein n=1 Tax=Pseudomonas fluorescens TaxID=294 RepID=A0A5E6SBA0_PSEFL|nr:hypothetical protein PS652_02025 [Pseudomonas fluorescens]
MLLDLGWRQAVEGLRLTLHGGALLGLPVAIGLVGNDPEGRQATVGQGLAAVLAGLLATQQQAHRPRRQGTAASTGEQAAQATAALAAEQVSKTAGFAGGAFAALVLQQVLAGF